MKLFKLLPVIGLFIVNAAVKADDEVGKPVDIVVYRSPSCGCCGKWVGHLKNNNFNVKDIVTSDVQAIKSKYGVPGTMASCHTALVEGYVIEGHVPANDINTLLKTKPKVTGIAVPDMPAGTPGMGMGGKKDPYQVISFDSEKRYQVFNSYESK
ncbi:DUF411 domain-containing protein [Methylobacter sp. BBA5.1]|uniref:DUF411 domain-containing protein n=1 Tax=Methylobacter sp. BBA5.1 TaxID=1495064 RepID=UPI0005643895|nr:DUF411 domain-containing protein [Methylobacter sp. BBA5.1]